MPHADTQIVNAVAARLVTMATVADGDVHKEFVYDFTNSQLPAINVYAGEAAVLDTEGDEATLGGMASVALQLFVVGYAKITTADEVGDTLREIVGDVVKKLYPGGGDYSLGGLISELDLLGWGRPELSGEEEKPIGRVDIEWRAVYRVLLTDPDTIQS